MRSKRVSSSRREFGPGLSVGEGERRQPGRDATARQSIREFTLRQAAQYALAQAQQGTRPAALRGRCSACTSDTFANSRSPTARRRLNTYLAEALFNTGDFVRAGTEYSRTAYGYTRDSTGAFAEQAGRNAIVAFDSALTKNPRDVGRAGLVVRARRSIRRSLSRPATSLARRSCRRAVARPRRSAGT